MNPSIRLAAILSGVLLIGAASYGYFFSDKARIRRGVSAAATAFEKRDLNGFMTIVSRNYQDETGATWDEISRGASDAFANFESFKVTIEKVEIHFEGDTARYTCLLTVTARTREKEAWMVAGTPESGQRMELQIRKESGGWRVERASGYTR